jgi:hypothetical protein
MTLVFHRTSDGIAQSLNMQSEEQLITVGEECLQSVSREISETITELGRNGN